MAEELARIDIAGYQFDPAEETPELSKELIFQRAPEHAAYFIVQLHRAPTREDRSRSQEELGLSLTDYVSANAYIERLDPGQREALLDDDLVRSITRYEPGFKISPHIGTRRFRTEERQAIEGLLVWIMLFPTGNPNDVARLAGDVGVEVLGITDDREFGGGTRVRILLPDSSSLPALAQIEEVRWIEEITELIDDNAGAASTNQSGTAATPSVWNQGLNGEGQIVGIIDAGLPDMGHCFFQDPVDNTASFSHRKIVANRNGSGSHWHSTFAAGCLAGDDFNNPGTGGQRGGAWAARLVCGTNGEVFSGSALTEFSEAASFGAFIHSNSWHENNTDGDNQAIYSQISVDTDTFVWNNEDHLVLGSAGNTDEEQGAPGTAKNAICVSAAQADPNENNIGDGNPGPTADGRRKPDMVGVGCGIQSANDGTACGVTALGCATSWATPDMAAAAALVRQYYTEGWYPTGTEQPHNGFVPSGALMKATLLNSTRNMTGVAGGYPNNTEGWGIVRLDDALYFDGGPLNLRVWDTRNADGLATGETADHHVDVASNTQRLKVTLVWTEPPSANNATTPLVNDLDLQVISPDGTQTFLGNVFGAGAFSATGGATDTTDNVEMVLINAPAPGDWTISVVGTAVNVGNPGQGYALVVTADLEEPPSVLGQQDTLVVRATFSDVAFEPPLPNLQNIMSEAADYVDEVSYGQATVAPVYRGPIALDHPRSYYYHPERSLLVELVEEVVAKLVAAEPGVFDGPTGDPSDDIDRMIIVINDVNFTGDWATTGPWPYNLPGGLTRPISVSVQSYDNSVARFTHGLLHQFGLVDLYAHPGVVFPRPYVDEWDNMADLFQNVHPLVWSKEIPGWLTAHGSNVQFIPRPAAGTSYAGTNPIKLFLQESTTTNRKAIALGLTEGAGSIAQESAFYYVEARSDSLGGFDDNLPDSGVLIYYVNDLIPQGQGPVIIRDDDLTTVSLADAPLDIGDTLTIPGTGITIGVLAGTGGADYDIQLTYTPPITDYNVRITRGDTINGQFYSYFSPDVWIDSPRNGFNLSAGPPSHTDRDAPVIGMVNRVYARIWNDGPATAFDFDVRFRISEPYHTVGGAADFDTFVGIAHISSLAAGDDTNVYVEWTPTNDGQSHACLLVDIINLVGNDTNPHDHEAQENLDKVTSVTSSPFHAVTYRYDLTNPYEHEALFYFRAEGMPDGWQVDLAPRKILLNPGERVAGIATITPPREAEVCTSELIQVTSWTPRGDTMINVGGAVVQVDLRRPTTLTLEGDTEECREEDLKELFERLREKGDTERVYKVWQRLALRAKDLGLDTDEVERSWELLYGGAATRGELIDPRTILRDWRLAYPPPPAREKPDPERWFENCGRVTATGCTDPPRPHEEIVVKFTDPAGNVDYITVTTDEFGCFEAFIVTVDEGVWQVEAEYPGNECDGPATSPPRSVCFCAGVAEREG